MHLIIQNLEVKIYVVQKFKRHKIKNHSNMFRIAYDPKHVRVFFYVGTPTCQRIFLYSALSHIHLSLR